MNQEKQGWDRSRIGAGRSRDMKSGPRELLIHGMVIHVGHIPAMMINFSRLLAWLDLEGQGIKHHNDGP